jgi:hypothetical protein
MTSLARQLLLLSRRTAALAVLCALVGGASPVEARGFFLIGVPLLGYPYWPAQAIVYVPPVIYASPVIGGRDVRTGSISAPSWYQCDEPRGFYPYVQTCTSGWRAVPAAPAANSR